MLKPYAALIALPALFILCPAPAWATSLTIEPVFSLVDPADQASVIPGEAPIGSFNGVTGTLSLGIFNPGAAPRLDTDSPSGSVLYPQTIPSDPPLTPDGDDGTPLILFNNNTDYVLTSFTLEIVGTIDPAADADATFDPEDEYDDAFINQVGGDDLVVSAAEGVNGYADDVTYAEVTFGDVGDLGFLGDIFGDNYNITAGDKDGVDGHKITFFGNQVMMGAIFVDSALMALGGNVLTDVYPERLAIKASFTGYRVPEPATGGLLLAGIAGIGLIARRRRQAAAAC